MMKGQVFDKEKIHINVARLKKGGENFEIVVDPDKAVEFKEKKDEGDVREILKAPSIFSDAKKGLLASEKHLKELFGTTDPYEIARIILKEGEIQLTQQYREKVREEKRKRVIHLLHINGVDPRTGNPHPEKRIELAMEEAKVRIDEFKRPEDQIKEIVKKLQPIIPISLEEIKIKIQVPPQYAAKLYSTVQHYATILKEDWLSDGSWSATAKIPAGLKAELMDELNKKTHGGVNIEIIKER